MNMREYKILCVVGAVFLIILSAAGSLKAQETWQSAVVSEQELTYEAVGNIQSKIVTTLSSKVVGNILEVLKREGDAVKAGEVVVKIDARDVASDLVGARAGLSEAAAMKTEIDRGLQAAVAQKQQAESGLKLAESSYQRIRELYDKKSVSRQEFDQAEAAFTTAQAQARGAQAQIDALEAKKSTVNARMSQAQAGISKVETIRTLAEVTSPFSGRVTARRIEPGMLAAPGVPLLTIEDSSQLRLEAMVPERFIASITEGQRVEVVIDALEGRTFSGSVAEILPSAEVMSHTFLVKIALAAQPGLRSGMYARGAFVIGSESVLLVPPSAIETRGQLEGIWVERDGKPVYRLVRTGRTMPGGVEIVAGLRPGDRFLPRPPAEGK
ncbi:MAG TPA: efflux RND transporter periplasmic adaptor subunit [Candidatus Ozemobacteraceae bacterium]|nr:efflux RND transporter periplasmic adaptor subunit [Candidatus Ozemobacteraceae bacterium]